MKQILCILNALLIAISPCFSQSCTGGPPITCSTEKVISPAIAPPTGLVVTSSTCSTLVVKWTGMANQQYVANAVFRNTTTNMMDSMPCANITCDANNNCTATFTVTPGVKYTCSVQAKGMMGQCTFYSYPAMRVLDYPIAACNQPGNTVSFSGKVMLQGAYNAATGNMDNTLNTAGILESFAAAQPYNTAAFNYAGTESVSAGFFAAHPSVVDWVLLELRDPNAPSTVIARRAAFVQQDGSLLETDGVATAIAFNGIAAGNYFVTIKHRNHLAVRSAEAIDFTNGNATYDFTTANFKCFRNQAYTSSVQMGNVWCMRGGNTQGNAVVKYTGPGNNQNQVLNVKLGGSLSLILNHVYAPEDVNMNGNIKWSGPGNDQNALLNTVLSGSLSAVLVEQY